MTNDLSRGFLLYLIIGFMVEFGITPSPARSKK
jgi:hypothetical protein